MRAFGLHFIELLYSASPPSSFGKELTIDISLSDFSVNSAFLDLVSVCDLACKIHCFGAVTGLHPA